MGAPPEGFLVVFPDTSLKRSLRTDREILAFRLFPPTSPHHPQFRLHLPLQTHQLLVQKPPFRQEMSVGRRPAVKSCPLATGSQKGSPLSFPSLKKMESHAREASAGLAWPPLPLESL